MSYGGTQAHCAVRGLPPLVKKAVSLATELGFEHSCHPAQGQLLRLLAGTVGPGLIGETGSGAGVGLAWLVDGAHTDAGLFSVERDAERAAAVRGLFKDRREGPTVEVVTADWQALSAYGPFDLLILDGGGHGKRGEAPIGLGKWIRKGGLLLIDDFTPTNSWPPMHQGEVDATRVYWYTHPELLACEVRITPELATLIGTYVGDDGRALARPAGTMTESWGVNDGGATDGILARTRKTQNPWGGNPSSPSG